jgi:hypothetical protein
MSKPFSLQGSAAVAALFALGAILLGGCTVKTSVQVTATTPGNVTHIYVTVQEIWVSTHAHAVSGGGKWKKKVLSDPVTIDLASLNGGATQDLGSLDLGAGTYEQVRLVLVDTDQELATSASDLNLAWNNAVQYVDNGLSRLVPLEFASPGAALVAVSPIRIKGNTILDTLGGSGDPAANLVVDVDALRNLTIFSYGGQIRTLLDPGLAAYNDADAGTITGTFDLSAIANSSINSRQGVVVSAERVEPAGTRHTAVKSVRLGTGGSFTLYPLPVDDTGTSTYDIVVHGPGVSTLIITGVAVDAGASAALQSSNITLPVAQNFLVNTATAVHGGTRAGFYQTLPTDARPYLVDFAAVNPFGGGFNSALALATADIVYGAWNDGEVISFASASPAEGNGTFGLAADSRWRASSGFGTVMNGGLGPNTAQLVDLSQPALPADAIAGAISGTIVFSAPDQFDALYLIVSRGGQIVETVNLGAGLPGSASVDFTVTDVPAGVPGAIYDVSVRAWNSADAANTLVRALFTPQADLRQGDVSGLSLQL